MELNDLFLKMLTCFVRQDDWKEQDIELTEEEWKNLYHLAKLHQVAPMIYEVAARLESFRVNPPKIAPTWKRDSMITVVTQTQKTVGFLALYKEMKEAGMVPLVMKGIICRNLYAQPDYRMSGDEDLLLDKEDFWKMDQFLIDRGFAREEETEDLEKQMATLHEVGYRNAGNGLYLEIHLTLFPEDSGAVGHYNDLFDSLRENAVSMAVEGTEIVSLSYTDHFLYLLCHSAKHFLHSGFGVRQVFDIILFAEKHGEKICWDEVIEKTKAHHLYIFMLHLFHIGVEYMECDMEKTKYPETLPENLDSSEMLEDLLEGGVFGASSSERVHSANLTLAAADQEKKKNGILASLFPSASYMAKKYEYVKKYPWLLPVGWLQRIWEYLTKEKQVDNQKVLEVGQKRVEILRKYGMID